MISESLFLLVLHTSVVLILHNSIKKHTGEKDTISRIQEKYKERRKQSRETREIKGTI